MKQTRTVTRSQVLKQMMELAMGSANDAVKLAYLPEERQEEIGALNLTCLTEFKRNGNGTVEVKLTDRVAVLEKLLEQMQEEDQSAAAFFQALEQPEGERSRR